MTPNLDDEARKEIAKAAATAAAAALVTALIPLLADGIRWIARRGWEKRDGANSR